MQRYSCGIHTCEKHTVPQEISEQEHIAHRDLEQLENTSHVFNGKKNIAGRIQNACRLFDLFSQPPSEFIFKDV